MGELSEYEKQVLAREIAADHYHGYSRDAFVAGWDAALQWKEKQDAPQLEQSSESNRP